MKSLCHKLLLYFSCNKPIQWGVIQSVHLSRTLLTTRPATADRSYIIWF